MLRGGAGVDTLGGNLGADQLFGDAGADEFRFGKASEGIDTIQDFSVAELDKLYIFAAGFGGGLGTGALAANRFVASGNPTTNQAFGQFLYNTATGALSYDSDGTGGAAAIQVANVFATGGAAATLTAADFLLFLGRAVG